MDDRKGWFVLLGFMAQACRYLAAANDSIISISCRVKWDVMIHRGMICGIQANDVRPRRDQVGLDSWNGDETVESFCGMVDFSSDKAPNWGLLGDCMHVFIAIINRTRIGFTIGPDSSWSEA
ncbi:hypothetical protein BS47DRAFT_1366208 [Hydnum rufescens UP504]|uniref:Uncharacterized protein n=1 Tax=Hydnum rufescens UP504 TaxID=1448309 RepID=A0A9P6ALG5_9AGAM|nr:hypothetical protein BS47DRAFT_1366208 [Hydnum rufescens UP504]